MYSLFCYTRALIDKTIDYITYTGESDTNNRIFSDKRTAIGSAISLYTDATQVLPNIYLGNIYNARNYYKLIDMRIGLVVNCTEEIADYFPDSFKYIRAPIRDSSGSSISPYVDNISDKVHNYLLENPTKSVLFHCYMGSSRSTSFLLAYLVKYMDMDLGCAIKFVKELRPIVNINSNFYRELKEICEK